jgi:cysteinyl-tRNA synthetase
MAKSLGNFFTLRDLMGKGFHGREVRYLLLSAHYRETFNFTLEGLHGARTALARIDECVAKLRDLARAVPPAAAGAAAPPDGAQPDLVTRFTAALDDDLNVSAAWAAVFDWVRDNNRRLADNSLSPAEAAAALADWEQVDSVLGIGTARPTDAPADILALMEARQAARKAKDFQRADALREELKAKGWTVEDTPKGPKPKRLSA